VPRVLVPSVGQPARKDRSPVDVLSPRRFRCIRSGTCTFAECLPGSRCGLVAIPRHPPPAYLPPWSCTRKDDSPPVTTTAGVRRQVDLLPACLPACLPAASLRSAPFRANGVVLAGTLPAILENQDHSRQRGCCARSSPSCCHSFSYSRRS